MKAALTVFKLDKATTLVSEIVENLGEEIFQILEGAMGSGSVVADEFGVADVEGGAEAVGGFLGGVAVDAPEAADGGGSAEHAGDFHTVGTATARLQRIVECLPYLLEQRGCFRDKVGKRVGELVKVIFLAGFHRNERTAEVHDVLVGDNRGKAESTSRLEVDVIGIIEHLAEGTNGSDADALAAVVGSGVEMAVIRIGFNVVREDVGKLLGCGTGTHFLGSAARRKRQQYGKYDYWFHLQLSECQSYEKKSIRLPNG